MGIRALKGGSHKRLGPTLRDGAIAGTLATAVMSGVMWARKARGKMGRMPPKIITDAAVKATGEELPEPALNLASASTHFAFGAATGSAFALMRERVPAARGVAGGIGFGTLVWLVSYAGWVPALGIMPAPPRDRPGRPFSMLAAHWVFGAVLGAFLRRRDGGRH